MTKDEAIYAMVAGKKVKHRFFSSGEYITIAEGKICTEDGYKANPTLFWHDRSSKAWKKDWEIYKVPD